MNTNAQTEIVKNSKVLYLFIDKTNTPRPVIYEPQYGVVIGGERTDGSARSAVKLIASLSSTPVNEDELISIFNNTIRETSQSEIENWDTDEDEDND